MRSLFLSFLVQLLLSLSSLSRACPAGAVHPNLGSERARPQRRRRRRGRRERVGRSKKTGSGAGVSVIRPPGPTERKASTRAATSGEEGRMREVKEEENSRLKEREDLGSDVCNAKTACWADQSGADEGGVAVHTGKDAACACGRRREKREKGGEDGKKRRSFLLCSSTSPSLRAVPSTFASRYPCSCSHLR